MSSMDTGSVSVVAEVRAVHTALEARTAGGRDKLTGGGGMTARTLWAFFALAFGLAWGLAALLMLFPDQVVSVFGEVGYTNPLFILAVYAPGLAGIFLVWRHYGVGGLRSYLRRVTLWRMPGAWWAVLILGIPAAMYAGAAMSGTIDDPFPFSPWYQLIPALGIALMIGPMEEFGWRGLALPLLQRRFTPLMASLILGSAWGLWHVPSFFISGTPQSAWSLGPYFVGVLAAAVIMTGMFNASRGSILIPILFHLQANNPAWPDAQPWDTLAFVLMAVAVVVLNRKTMLTRGAHAVTDVLSAGAQPPQLPPTLPVAIARPSAQTSGHWSPRGGTVACDAAAWSSTSWSSSRRGHLPCQPTPCCNQPSSGFIRLTG